MPASTEQLDRAFNPRVVAVVGDKQMNGFMWLRALQAFQGKLYSVQIDAAEIPLIEAMGVANVKSLHDIPEPIDYVVLAVPRAIAPRIVADCVAVRAGSAMLFTAGFSETGDPEGIRLEEEIAAIAREGRLLLVGPNCMGLANPGLGLCNFPGETAGAGAAGSVAFLGQSGTHTIAFLLRAAAQQIGVSKAASFGNGVLVDGADYLDYFRSDPATTIIAGYVEGVRAGRRFFEVLCATTPTKPVVLWKGGVTEAGHRAIFSHTAALATPTAVWNGMVRQAGAIPADSLDEVLDIVRLLAAGKTVTQPRAGLIAMTGGPSVVMTDAFVSAGLEVPPLGAASSATLAEFFNLIGGSMRNPLDAGSTIAMGFRLDNLARLVDVLDGDDEIDVIAIDLGTGLSIDRWLEHPALVEGVIDALADFAQRSAKPLVAILDPAHREAEVAGFRTQFARRGIVALPSPQRAARALRKVIDYHRFRAGLD